MHLVAKQPVHASLVNEHSGAPAAPAMLELEPAVLELVPPALVPPFPAVPVAEPPVPALVPPVPPPLESSLDVLLHAVAATAPKAKTATKQADKARIVILLLGTRTRNGRTLKGPTSIQLPIRMSARFAYMCACGARHERRRNIDKSELAGVRM